MCACLCAGLSLHLLQMLYVFSFCSDHDCFSIHLSYILAIVISYVGYNGIFFFLIIFIIYLLCKNRSPAEEVSLCMYVCIDVHVYYLVHFTVLFLLLCESVYVVHLTTPEGCYSCSGIWHISATEEK